MHHPLRSALLGFAVVLPLSAQAPPPPPPQIETLTAAGEAIAAQVGRRGAVLAVVKDGKVVHRSEHGRMRGDTVIPIASASKWLCVATVLSVVESGELDLDQPVRRYLPAFDRPDKRGITLRQCLSCTAGFAARDADDHARDATMTTVAAAIAEAPLHANPGTEFVYSGRSFQVAACAAEAATGKSFHRLFAERIAAPLELHSTAFGRLVPVGSEAGTAAVPWVAGGAVSSADEYARFVAMLAARGEYGGVRVLRADSVLAMVSPQNGDTQVRMPGFAGELRYGLGTWIQSSSAQGSVRVCDPGAFGFTPWLELDLAAGGVLAVQDRLRSILGRLPGLQDEVRTALQAAPLAGRDEVVTLAHGGRDRSYLLHVPPQAATSKSRLPLLLVLHGGGGNGRQVADSTHFAAVADREGFVVAFPDGTGRLRGKLLTWNSGGIPVYAAEAGVDDVGFLKAVVADVQTRVAVDPDRVHATGMSNGAMMCHRLAREAADVFAAVAPVSGAMDFTAVDSPLPIGVMIVHGTGDQHVLYAGGRPKQALGKAADRVDASVAEARDYYLARNHLDREPRTARRDKVTIEDWDRGQDGRTAAFPVRVVTLEGGGHAWPGGVAGEYPGADVPFPFEASAAIWAFFAPLRREAR